MFGHQLMFVGRGESGGKMRCEYRPYARNRGKTHPIDLMEPIHVQLPHKT